jgi:site-specific recombinase XerD
MFQRFLPKTTHPSQTLLPEQHSASFLDGLVSAWLHEKHAHSNSLKTARAYEDTMRGFRATLHQANTDLDGEAALVAFVAQSWTNQPRERDGRSVSNATYNQRVAILSSFYRYAIKKGVLHDNPMLQLDRKQVNRYAGARPMEQADVAERLDRIIQMMEGDPTLVKTQAAARDYALFGVAFTTGRRVSEVAGLVWGDVERARNGAVMLYFRHLKGGKTAEDVLDAPVVQALEVWLRIAYGARELTPELPLWMALDNGHMGHQLTPRALENIARQWLGTFRFHITRHTFAHLMEEAGAKISEIQAKLGHSDIGTTGIYLAALRTPENKYVGTLSSWLGFQKQGPRE